MPTVELQSFPGWYCTNCGHAGPSRHSHPVYCPACNQQKTQGYYGPVATHPRVQTHVGSHDLCHPSDKQWVIEFVALEGYPGGKRVSVMFDADSEFDTDGMTILRVAEQAMRTSGGWSSKRQALPPLIEWLRQHQTEHDLAQGEFRAQQTAWELWKAYNAAMDAAANVEQLRIDHAENKTEAVT